MVSVVRLAPLATTPPPGTFRGITVRCDQYVSPPNAQLTYDVHTYANIVYTGINGAYLLDATEASNGNIYRVAIVQEMVGGSASPQATLAIGSQTRSTGDLVESYFSFNGVTFPAIVPDYFVSTDLFDDSDVNGSATTAPACGLPDIGSGQRETALAPWDMRWDAGLPDC